MVRQATQGLYRDFDGDFDVQDLLSNCSSDMGHRAHEKHKNFGRPFNGDDVLHFFDSKITPGSKGKPVPNDGVVRSGFRIISSYGTFTYPKSSGYELTKYERSRHQTWPDDSVKAGRLTKGVWKKRVWLNVMVVSRMGKAWLDHHHKHGTWNWNITIAKLLSIVLIPALDVE
ncbi:hypothetical protein V1527DRAFT_490413 [Lipomyces starkeyi]